VCTGNSEEAVNDRVYREICTHGVLEGELPICTVVYQVKSAGREPVNRPS
jgi:hypothetical protein